MTDEYIIKAALKLRIKRFIYPQVDDPQFVEKLTRKQRTGPTLPSLNLVKGLEISHTKINGRLCVTIRHPEATNARHLLFLHGGAFVMPVANMHWRFVTDLVRRTKHTVTLPLYPLVPAHNYKHIHDHLKKVYEHVLSTTTPENITLIGDSAGGNLALALALLLPKASQPGRVVAISPVVDLRATNPRMDQVEPHDPILSLEAIRHFGIAYYADHDPETPHISPLFADFSQVQSDITLFNGGRDVLSPDISLLHQKMTEANITHNYVYERTMPHVWPLLPLRAARDAREKIVQFV